MKDEIIGKFSEAVIEVSDTLKHKTTVALIFFCGVVIGGILF
jgi:hypothetical protein